MQTDTKAPRPSAGSMKQLVRRVAWALRHELRPKIARQHLVAPLVNLGESVAAAIAAAACAAGALIWLCLSLVLLFVCPVWYAIFRSADVDRLRARIESPNSELNDGPS